MREAVVVLFSIILFSVGLEQAYATTIDFDTFPDGTPVPSLTRITDQYASCGVALFTTEVPEGPQVFGFSQAGVSPPNQLGADGPPGNPAFTHSIGVQFVSPVTDASINAIDVDHAGLILEAFDSGNVLVDSVQIINAAPVTQMSVSGNDITSLVIRQITPAAQQGFLIDGYNIDDLQFTGPECDEQINVIGGEIIPIEATSLFLAGMQTNFSVLTSLVAVVAGAFGALYYITKRKISENS